MEITGAILGTSCQLSQKSHDFLITIDNCIAPYGSVDFCAVIELGFC